MNKIKLTPSYYSAFSFSLLSALFIFYWHKINMEIPSFDSIRYYELISFYKTNINFSEIITFRYFPWSSLLSIISGIFNTSLSELMFINNFFSLFFILVLLTISAESKNDTKKIILLQLLLLLNIPFLNLGKVLLPEYFSYSFVLAEFLLIRKSQFKYKSLLISTLAILSFIVNASTIIFQLLFIFHFIEKKINKKYFSPVFILSLLFLTKFLPNPLSDGLPAYSWSTSQPDLSTSILIKSIGFFSFSSNFIWLVILFLIHPDCKSFCKKLLQYKYYFLLYLIFFSLIKPETSNDFINTGYRYFIPLNIVILIIWSDQARSLKYNPLLKITLIVFLVIISIFSSIKYTFVDDLHITFNIHKNLPEIELISFRNKIVSGHISSKNQDITSETQSSAKRCSEYINKTVAEGSLIFSISNNENFHHYLKFFQLENNSSNLIFGDQKNPFIPQKIQSFVNSVKSGYSYLECLSNTHILMLLSDYLIFHENNDQSEKSLENIYYEINSFFKSQLSYLQEIYKFQNNNGSVTIYSNPLKKLFLQNKNVIINNRRKVIIWQEDQIKDNNSLQVSLLRKSAEMNNLECIISDNNSLRNKLLENYESILILPYDYYFPSSLLTEIADFLNRGGKLFINGQHPFSRIFPATDSKTEKSLLNYLDKSAGIIKYKCLRADSLNNHSDLKINNLEKKFNNISCIDFITGERTENRFHKYGNFFPYRSSCAEKNNLISLSVREFENAIPVKFIFFTKPPVNNFTSLSKIFINSCPAIFSELDEADLLNNYNLIISSLNQDLTISKFFPENIVMDNSNLNLTISNLTPESSNIHLSLNNDKNETVKKVKIFLKPWEVLKRNIKLPPFINKSLELLSVTSEDLPFQKITTKIPVIFETKSELPEFINLLNSGMIYGINYYPSSNYDRFWIEPDFYEVEKDLSIMQNFGINSVRMHFIHPDWYEDVYTHLGLKSDSSFRYRWQDVLKVLLSECRKKKIFLILDIFTFLPNNMGSPKGWKFPDKRYSDKRLISNQNSFLYEFLSIVRSYDNIIIDLVNEPLSDSNLLYWYQEKLKIIKSITPSIPVTIGGLDNYSEYKDLDFFSPHFFINKPTLKKYTKPVVAGEVWLRDFSLNNLEDHSLDKTKFKAVYPWGFTSPANLYSFYSNQEEWEASLGIMKRGDNSLNLSNINKFCKKTG